MNGGEYWTYAAWPHPVQSPFAGPSPALTDGRLPVCRRPETTAKSS